MAILDAKEKIEIFRKNATGYVKQLLSADDVVMSDGTTLQKKMDSLNSALTTNGSDITLLKNSLNNKANSSHTHDDRYYTESEINSKLNGKSDINHRHQWLYDCKNDGHTFGISWNGSKMLFYVDGQLMREW